MARLPVPGSDTGTWGDILNSFLEVSLNGDGSLQTLSLQNAGGVTKVNGKTPVSGAVTLAASDIAGVALLSGAAFTGAVSTAGTLTASLAIVGGVSTLADGANIAVNVSLGNHFRVTLGGNRTLSNPSNPTDAQKIIVEVIQDATGSRTLAFGTAYSFGSGLPSPTLTTTANKRDFLGFVYNASTGLWYFIAFVNGF